MPSFIPLCVSTRGTAACDASCGAMRNARTSNVIYSQCSDLKSIYDVEVTYSRAPLVAHETLDDFS